MPLDTRLALRLLPPFREGGLYILGADALGHPLLQEVARGVATSLCIAFFAVLTSALVGIPYGALAAWRKGAWERSFLFFADSFQAFPGMLLAIALAAFLRPSLSALIAVLGITGWVGFGRLARAQALSLVEREFIVATRALGIPPWRILVYHLLPNMARPIVVQGSFALAGAVLAEATLSFLGLGLPPEIASLGKMVAQGVRYLLLAPHAVVVPGFALFALVLFFNWSGDSLADRLDPKGKQRAG